MSNVLKSQGKYGPGQMIENHQGAMARGMVARPGAASPRPTPPFTRPAGARRATPGGASRRVTLPPPCVRPFGFLAKAPEAGR